MEKGALFHCRVAKQDVVAVREAAKTLDDIPMFDREGQVSFAKRLAQLAAKLLIGQFFRMHEGQIEENPELRIDRLIMAARNRVAGIMKRQRIGRVHMRRATETVAGKLVEEKEEREAAFRRIEPAGQFLTGRCEVQIVKAGVEGAVEMGVLLEPFIWTSLVPEGKNLGGGCRYRALCYLDSSLSHTALAFISNAVAW